MYALIACALMMLVNLTSVSAATVTASSYQAPNVPENVIDGDVNTRWSAEGDNQNRIPATLIYDIGQVETINLIRIAWQDSLKRTNYFELSVSTDGEEWVLIDPFVPAISKRNGAVWETHIFAAMPVRYVRIDGYGNSSRFEQWVSIREVEVDYDEGILMDGDVRVLGSSPDRLTPPSNVIDNDYGTRWSAFSIDDTGMLIGTPIDLDFWEPITITSVLVAWHEGNKRKYFFDIQVSDDLENWELVYEGESSGTTKELETYELDSPITARYVRLTGYGNSSKCAKCSRWTSITEMRVDEGISGSVDGVGSTR